MSIDSLAAWSSSSWSADPPWAAAAQREALTAAGASWWRTRREFLDPELLSRPMFQMTALAGAGMTWGLRAATRGTREVRGGWAARHTAPRGRGDRRRGRHRHQHDERVDGAGPPGNALSVRKSRLSNTLSDGANRRPTSGTPFWLAWLYAVRTHSLISD